MAKEFSKMEKQFLPEISKLQIAKTVEKVLPEKSLQQIIDHGVWVRHNFELVFEDGSRAFMKIHVHDDWLDSTINEIRLSEILREHELPGPETIYSDPQGNHFGLPFLIQSVLEGIHMSEWLSSLDQEEWPRLFKAVGETYSKIHRIKGPSSGVWDHGPEKTLPISPNDFYFNSEIMDGSGKFAYDSGFITKQEYLKIQSIWEEHLQALKEHTPSLIHGSPFPWTICLLKDGKSGFQVTRLNALGDFLWWDPAYDVAFLLYPPGYQWPDDCRQALADAYGLFPEEWRIILYAIMQHLCALNDVYLAPGDEPGPKIFKKETISRLKKLVAYF
jgi:hypothetical protein